MSRIFENVEILNEKPRQLLPNVLPTTSDVLRAIQHAKQTLDVSAKTPWKTFVNAVATEVHEIWNKASVPTSHFNQIVKRTTKLNKEFLLLLNADITRKDKPHYIQKVNDFTVSLLT